MSEITKEMVEAALEAYSSATLEHWQGSKRMRITLTAALATRTHSTGQQADRSVNDVIERAAHIADPWPTGDSDAPHSDQDKAIITVRREIAAHIRLMKTGQSTDGWRPINPNVRFKSYERVDLWVVNSAYGGRREANGCRDIDGDWIDQGGNKLDWSYIEKETGKKISSIVTHWQPLPARPLPTAEQGGAP